MKYNCIINVCKGCPEGGVLSPLLVNGGKTAKEGLTTPCEIS